MAIDIAYPDTGAELQRGKSLQRFGQQALNLLDTLTKAAGQAGEALYKGKVFTEFTEAQRYAMSAANEYDYAAQNSTAPNWEATWKGWDEQKKNIEQKAAAKYITTQDARDEFAKWWTVQGETVTDTYRKMAIDEIDVKAEAAGMGAIMDAARMGMPELIPDIGLGLFRSGAMTKEESVKLIMDNVKIGNYNKVKKELDKLGNDKAIQLLATTDYGLEEGQVEDMIASYQFETTALANIAQRQKQADADAKWPEFDKKYLNGEYTTPEELRSAAAAFAGTTHDTVVRSRVESLFSAWNLTPDKRLEAQQSQNANKAITQLFSASQNMEAEMPSLESMETGLAGTAQAPALYNDTGFKEIRSAYELAVKSRKQIEAGVVSQEAPLYGKLYGAVDAGKNPGIEVPIAVINEAWNGYKILDANGNRDEKAYEAILAKRLELQKRHESGEGSTTEAMEIEAYRRVFGASAKVGGKVLFDYSSWTVEQKTQWIAEQVGHGISADDAAKWNARIQPFNGRDDYKQAASMLSTYYQTSMAAANTNDRSALAIEMGNALAALESLSRQPGITPEKLMMAAQSSIDKHVEASLETFLETNILRGKFGEVGLPGFTMYGAATDAKQLDLLAAAYEQGPGIISQFPTMEAEYKKRYADIERREREFAQGAFARGETVTKTTPATEAERTATFYTTPGGRRYAYRVRSVTNKNGDIRRTVFRLDLDAATLDWTVVREE